MTSPSSKFEVLTPADDPSLLTPAELAAMFPNETPEVQAALGLESSEWIAQVCGVRAAGVYSPTFKEEAIRETFLAPIGSLVLGRRFVSAVTVLENGGALAEGADFMVQDVQGIIERVSGAGYYYRWWGVPVVVEYTAGFSTVPAILKAACADYCRLRLAEAARDPLARSESTVDLDSITYGSGDDAIDALARTTASRLSRFITGVPG